MFLKHWANQDFQQALAIPRAKPNVCLAVKHWSNCCRPSKAPWFRNEMRVEHMICNYMNRLGQLDISRICAMQHCIVNCADIGTSGLLWIMVAIVSGSIGLECCSCADSSCSLYFLNNCSIHIPINIVILEIWMSNHELQTEHTTTLWIICTTLRKWSTICKAAELSKSIPHTLNQIL